MAFLRFSRDKRGYEHFALVQPTTNRRGATRQRLLYVYRTPPDVKVGREPFDEAVRRALEAQYPDVSFDWRKILETPIPSADAERWRQRRRAERAARQAASAEVAAGAAEDVEKADAAEGPELPAAPQESAHVDAPAGSEASANLAGPPALTGDASRRRRRRRRGRRGRPDAPVAASGTSPEMGSGASGVPNEAGHAAASEGPRATESVDTPIESPGE